MILDDYLPESDGVDARSIYLIDGLMLCGMADDDNVKVLVSMPESVSFAFGSDSEIINRRCSK